MKFIFFLIIFFLSVWKAKCENFEDSLELQILKELTQEDKKCIKTSGEIIFILDGSTSVGPDNFNKEKDFATQIVDKLVIGDNLTRVSLITYNNNPLMVFNLDKYNNSKDVNREILKAEFTEGITVVGDALNMVLTDIEPKTRKSTGKVIILISDGKRNGGMDPILVAKQLKSMNYLLITIGLDKETDENAMIAISDKNNFYLIKNFDALQKIVKTIVDKTCTEFHISKCSKPIVKEGPCIGREQVNIVTTFYYVNGKCISENRKLTIKCLGSECPDPYYQKMSCGSENSSFILFHNFTKNGKLCASTTVNLKKFTCGCPKSEESILKVIYGKECENGFRKQMLLYYEFSQFKCSETYLNLSPVKCSSLCNGTTLVTTPCKNGKRNNTIYSKVFKNNTCSLQIVQTTESHCETTCPKSILIESKDCVNNSKDVFHITFDNINGKCIKKTTKIKSNNCTNNQECPQPKLVRSDCEDGKRTIMRISYRLVQSKCTQVNERMGMENCTIEKCSKSHYKVENCEKNSKTTFLVKTYYRKQNGVCVKFDRKIKQLSCRCQTNNDRNITVIVGKECIRGFVSRYLELTEERNDKCVKVSFTLKRIRCGGVCSRRPKFIVGKCKSNSRLLQLVKAVKKDNKCVWETIRRKSVKCVTICPSPKERKTRCIRGKQIVQRVTFREAKDDCKYNFTKVRVISCKGCSMKPIYTVGKCEKNQKNTSLVRISFHQANSTCIKRQNKIVELSCECYGATDTNVTVTFGRECINGFLSRVAELNVLNNGKCSKVAFKLRGVPCRKPCDRRTKIVVGKCKANKRSVTVLRAVRENNECKWKTVTSKFVKCKNVCPSPKEKRSRCILKKQAIFRVTFKEVGETCQFNLIRLNIVPCQGCQNSTYRVEKCQKDAKETSLIRTFFNEINGTCIKKEITVKKLSCRCIGNTTKNIEVVVGKQCENGYISRILELTEERNDKCVKVSFKLRRIRCQRPCSRQLKLVVNKCVSNKRLIQRMKSVKEGDKCVWKVLNSKTVHCKEICPLPRERRSRCYRGMQAVTKVTFKLIGNICVPQVLNLNITKCQKCPRSVYRIEKCEKNSNQTFLIRTFFQSINGNCLRKEQNIKPLPCKCYDNITRNISVIIGKECRNGYKSRVIELTIEKNQKCVKELFSLRSIRCENICNKTEMRKDSCVFNKRFLKLYKQVQQNGRCDWVLVSSKLVNCTNECPKPKITTTPCINGERSLIRTTYKLVGSKCVSSEQKIKLLKCQKCFRKSVYELKKCSKNSKTSELIRISHQNCTKKIEKLIDVDCSCESLNNYGINVTSVASCINGFRSKTVSFFTTVNGKCILQNLSVKGGKCGCFGSSISTSICVNGNRTVEKHTKYQSGSQCLSKMDLSRKLRCKSICPINPIILSRKCFDNQKLRVFGVIEQSGNYCKLVKFNFKWSECSSKPISDVICSRNHTLTMSNCHNGSAFIVYTKFAAKTVNGKCVGNSSKIAEIACSGRCERTIRPKLVSGKCVKNIKRLFFIASRPQGNQCLHKIDYLGKIDCKNC